MILLSWACPFPYIHILYQNADILQTQSTILSILVSGISIPIIFHISLHSKGESDIFLETIYGLCILLACLLKLSAKCTFF